MQDNEPLVVAGAVLALRLYDVAHAIDLPSVERIWADQPRPASSRLRLISTPTKAVAFGVAPVEVPLAPVTLDLPDGPVTATVLARLYDFGVVTLALRVPAERLGFAAFTGLVNAVDRAVGTHAVAAVPWPDLLQQVRTTFADALTRPSENGLEEDYLLGMVEAFDTPMTAEALQTRIDLVPLLSGETRPLAASARADLLARRFSYYTDDFVALTWDRAFIYEPRGDSDVLDALEVANAQLLEMRYYDELLDDELPRMYDLVEGMQRARSFLSSRRFAGLARRLYGLVAEVTELTERVDNALQVTEDVYLARVYGAALELFRVSAVSAAVDRKLSIVRDTYAALYEEASSGRAAVMEAAVVVLICVEVGLALWPLWPLWRH
ncbi:MAG: hypothetical protein P4L71_13675 [Acetobacteraceae bacterium]|nr:hypothetical protein [Acetobacteraceae bacterium]